MKKKLRSNRSENTKILLHLNYDNFGYSYPISLTVLHKFQQEAGDQEIFIGK